MMDSEGAVMGAQYEEHTVQVGDLGRFSMRAIYDALATTTQASYIPNAHKRTLQVDPEDSDCSWTQEDEGGTFYFDMQRKLNSFAASDHQSTWTTARLTKSQRRFVHATAQIMRLGHASLGPRCKLRRMIVFKDTGARVVDLPCLNNITHAIATPPLWSSPSSARGSKRRRYERVENGFPCHHCEKLFDRASERTKHEQAHQPNLTSRYPCPVCAKGFRYPKDLRRHSKVHEKATGASGTQSLSSSYDSAPLGSSLTADSRVPSDISLTFSSNVASNNASPVFMSRREATIPELEIEPLVLDDRAWPVGVDDWLFDPQSGLGNGDDDDFLEMAKVRR